MLVKAYMTKAFARFARRERIPGRSIVGAAMRIEEGSIDADLGGGLFKQRVARPGAGRSGGWRTIIVHRRGDITVFVHGFAKQAQDNLSERELAELKRLANVMLGFTPAQVRALADDSAWIRVNEDHGGDALQE